MMERCWVYKWDESVPGKFYSIDEGGRRREGRINLDPSTGAANWVVILLSKKILPKLPAYVPFIRAEWDEEAWWCSRPDMTPEEFVGGAQEVAGAFLYFPSNNIVKYATFLERNKKRFGISGVVAAKRNNGESVLSNFFLQKARRDPEFKAYGSFLVNFDDRGWVQEPFDDFVFETADFAKRPDMVVASYDLEVANTDGWPGFPYGLLPNERIVGISASQCLMDGPSGSKKGESQTHLWILVPECAKSFTRDGVRVYTDE
jgi:hypothetical protein